MLVTYDTVDTLGSIGTFLDCDCLLCGGASLVNLSSGLPRRSIELRLVAPVTLRFCHERESILTTCLICTYSVTEELRIMFINSIITNIYQ